MDRELIAAYAVLCEVNCELRARAERLGHVDDADMCDRRAKFFAAAALLAAQRGSP